MTPSQSALPPWENVAFRRQTQLNWRKTLIAAAIVLLAAVRWAAPPLKSVQNVFYHLDVIPILLGGMWFGWRGAGWGIGLTAALEFPQLWVVWRHDLVYASDQIGELAVFGIAGLVVGALADREHRTTLELERVYTELRLNLEKLKAAERLSAVAQLSASLAHEIRNPLVGISGAAGILKRGNASEGNVRECIEIIQKESQRLNKLLTNFLEFARPRAPKFQTANLGEVIDSVIAVASHAPGAERVEFRPVVGALPDVECDAEQLKQVLLNLAINAIQASREGVVELRAESREGRAVITVRDQGNGIPKDQRLRIFDPFYTTKEDGTGLGLAVAAKIVEQHGGQLTAEDAPGRGTDMVVQIPLRRPGA